MLQTRALDEPDEITLWVCGLSVRIRVDDVALGRAIRAAWRPTMQAEDVFGPPLDGVLDPTVAERGHRGRDSSVSSLNYDLLGGTLEFQGDQLNGPLSADEAMARFERHLLDELTIRYADRTLLHAGAVVVRGDLVLLLGPSGIGKSTMTREALRAGHEYITDDFVVVGQDGAFGASRSVQFDPVRTSALPQYVADCDTESYRFVREGEVWAVPLYFPSRPARRRFALGSGRVHLCRLRRCDTNEVRRVVGVEKLVALHEATLTLGRTYDGCLDGAMAWEVAHVAPEIAFALLDAALLASSHPDTIQVAAACPDARLHDDSREPLP